MNSRNNEIPVRRRGGGVPWWAWLIGLALLGLLALWLLGNLGGNNNGATGANGGSGAGAAQTAGNGAGGGANASGDTGGAAGGGAITEVTEISGAADSGSVAGRDVEIEEATVQSVTGDITFVVGSGEQDEVFVRMDEDASGGEQGIQIEEGQTVSLTGTVEEVPGDAASLDLSDDEQQALGDAPVYVSASRVEVVR